MRDVRKYWQEVRTIQAALPEFVWLVDTANSQPVQVPAERAATLLYAKSHRIADEMEVAMHQATEGARDFQARHEQLRRKGIAVVRPPLRS